MFSSQQRRQLRQTLLEQAADDPRISGAAITGSAAEDREDAWSDVDLAFGIADSADMTEVVDEWTAAMYRRHAALHHVDVRAGEWLYRVFLLPDTLQVDLAFVPAREFRALSPTFKLVTGAAQEPGSFPAPSVTDLIGFGWLHALHARTSIARGKLWQAEYMVSGTRHHALALACKRHGLSAHHARGIDQLPLDVTDRFEGTLVTRLDEAELTRAFHVTLDCLIAEINATGTPVADSLQRCLSLLKSKP